MELPVVVLAEQGDSGARESIGFAQLQPGLECVVQLDLASTARHEYATFPVDVVSF